MKKTSTVILSSLVSVFLYSAMAEAKVKTQVIEYKEGNQVLEGFLAYDDAIKTKKPGVIVVHEWKGLDDYAKKRAKMVAELGYIAFAPDIYGKGIRPTTPEEAGKQAGMFKSDRPLLRKRVNAGYDVLKNFKFTDPNKIGAIGYCFGGTTALELARSGANVKGTVSFHGGLSSPTPDDAKNIKGKVLVLHGADDNFVPEKEVLEFQSEMRNAKIDWSMTSFGNSVHGFTNPNNGNDNSKGLAYNEKADKRSWEQMKDFFQEVFKK